jgi:hypothetical protein
MDRRSTRGGPGVQHARPGRCLTLDGRRTMAATERDLDHHATTVTDGVEHQAVCSCDWESDWYEEDTAAVIAGVEHPELVPDPVDRLDGFMSELLDLQDDLVRVVEWVAENWSADMPVPSLWGTPGRPNRPLDVSVLCDSEAELDAVADELGVPVTSDPVYDSDGATYRCARRRFGRIMFEAWRCQL